MMNEIKLRLARLRELMKREHLSAFIFPSTDAHQSEYVADHWRGREWISGFNGSAGTAVVTMKSAALWTDSRYFLAAEEQLEDTEYQLMRLKMEGTPTIAEWLGKELQDVQSPEVGLDGMVNSYNYVKDLSYSLRKLGGITLRTNLDPLEQIWENRPSLPANPVEIQPLEYAGETLASKVVRIRKSLRELHADGMLVSALDDIAWTLNLRGTDVHCNPVFVSYLLIESDKVSLFVDDNKLSPEVKQYLQDNQVSLYNYNKVEKCLESYSEYNILLDGDETSYYLWKTVKCQEIVAAASPIPAMKAVKNKAEIEGYRSAMLKDGVAMVKFLKWLKPAVEAGGQTEISIDEKLTSLRAEQKLFRDISFDTIAGYAQHGAIVHYEATPETDVVLKPEGLILIDSGAQYQNGTTDITRTIALGAVSEEMKHIYTLVLKAHIQLELVKFPDGASGTQLDAVGRECMWREGYNFLHGTGHGVGSYLCVHEGPHQIRMEWMPTPLRAGMTLTDEPGLYLAGKFGVRIENTVLISDYMSTEFGKFLQIEPLTLCPIDTTPIDVDMLLPEEIDWLNAYHHSVYEKLSPFLDEEEKIWLENATKPIK
ncbi:aminopeptidase P family protein [Prevotella copri]|uniref:Aminopeptidase P family protein n=2 Tax=Segatella copri TaxID=165179 RepID=A0A6A7VY89_9BACT|nr:aminopeptidase P family protein [Segatella copri]MQN08053.1 aminopeptidase P family protein [Segatella copri]MQN09741.1 aminopeptidase P family protein [Segatella copri]MQO62288.1 aminopeptidase P family protein [Segatella copri]MQO62926.1 aminopeptidase P family protein [Segatella copri]